MMRVLIITVEPSLVASIQQAVEREGRVDAASGMPDALGWLVRETSEVVVLDGNLPGVDLAEACRRLRGAVPRAAPTIVVAMDAGGAEQVADSLGDLADDLLVVPAGPRFLGVKLRMAMRTFADRAARRAIEDRLTRIAESAVVAVAVADLEGTFDAANEALLRLIGYTREEIAAGRVTRANIDAAPVGDPTSAESDLHTTELVRKGGARVPVVIGRELIKVASALGFIGDLSQRKAIEIELREVTAFLDSVIEHIPFMVFVKDAKDLRFERFNRAGEELLGVRREQLLGKNDYDFFPKEQADFFQQKDRETLASGSEVDIPEEPIQTPYGERWLHTRKVAILDANGAPRHLLGISEDITERRQLLRALHAARDDLEERVRRRTADLAAANEGLQHEGEERKRAREALERSEEQLLQAQKMEAIGQLAGGVAHDFNNLLSIILSYASLEIRALQPGTPLREHLEEIRSAAQRAAALTHQLLAFSRQQVLQPSLVDLNDVVASMVSMLARIIGEDVELTFNRANDLGLVSADRGQIEQLILNLAVNARDAMPGGGKLQIETANVALDDVHAAEHPGVTPGPHVMLAVSDTGVGMDAATRARIFEPFFTTKVRGKGTGLGLSTVFGIVKQSGGTVWVSSEPGQGAVFKVYFPRSAAAAIPAEPRPSSEALHGWETVLVVEDEEHVRAVARAILRARGYVVLEASSGAEALALCEAHAGPVHLLITDVVMPRMSGPQLVEQIRSLRPGTKALYMSGYTDDAVVHHGILDPSIQFLQKPFTPESLALKVRAVLDAPDG